MGADVRFTQEMRRECVGSCVWRLRTVLLLVLLAVPGGLGAALRKDKKACDSPACREAATRITNNMDPSAKPCDDFYQYACGGYLKNNVLSAKELYRTPVLTDMVSELNQRIKSLVESESPLDRLNSVKQAKIFYKSCMDEASIEKAGTKPLKDLVEPNGGWDPLGTKWNEENFNLEDYLIKMDKLRRNLIDWTVVFNPLNVSQALIAVHPASLNIQIHAAYKFPRAINVYMHFIYSYLNRLGVDEKVAKTEVPKIMDFEIKLAAMAPAPGSQIPDPNNMMSLEKASEHVIGIDLIKVLNGGLAPYKLTKTSTVMLLNSDYWKKYGELLANTEKRTIAAYVLMSSLIPFAKYLDTRTRKLGDELKVLLIGATGEKARHLVCIKEINTLRRFDRPIARLFVEKYNSEGTGEIKQMTERIKKVFIERLDHEDWLDDDSRQKAKTKAENMLLKLGYPEEILDDAKLDEYYKNTDLKKDDYFGNVLKMQTAAHTEIVQTIEETRRREDWKYAKPVVANAYHSTQENTMIVPIGILMPPEFDPQGPKSLNYGAIGKIIGHEITHGFDSMGRHFNQLGNQEEWMSKKSIQAFEKRSKCIEDQFSNITIAQLGDIKVNGKLTLGENIADAGAIQQSFQAYQEWVRENGKEEPLPGLDLCHNKLFFVSYAQTNCMVWRTEYLYQYNSFGVHTPYRERVLGTLMNSKDFAKTFKCKAGSPYNPTEKCKVW